MLLSWLSDGPLKGGNSRSQVVNLNEYVDLVRRVQTPYYEEARPRFDEEKIRDAYGDANECAPYRPDNLREIANER